MELNRKHFPVTIFYNFRSGLTQQQRIDNLIQCLAMKRYQEPVSMYGKFNRGRSSLRDEFREGHPKSVVVLETIDAVLQLILQDRHVTYCKIETTLGH